MLPRTMLISVIIFAANSPQAWATVEHHRHLMAGGAPDPAPEPTPCADSNSCGLGEGDCNNDNDCLGDLECGSNNCVGDQYGNNEDCCESGVDTSPAPTPGNGGNGNGNSGGNSGGNGEGNPAWIDPGPTCLEPVCAEPVCEEPVCSEPVCMTSFDPNATYTVVANSGDGGAATVTNQNCVATSGSKEYPETTVINSIEQCNHAFIAVKSTLCGEGSLIQNESCSTPMPDLLASSQNSNGKPSGCYLAFQNNNGYSLKFNENLDNANQGVNNNRHPICQGGIDPAPLPTCETTSCNMCLYADLEGEAPLHCHQGSDHNTQSECLAHGVGYSWCGDEAGGVPTCAAEACTVCLNVNGNGNCMSGGGHDTQSECVSHNNHIWCGGTASASTEPSCASTSCIACLNPNGNGNCMNTPSMDTQVECAATGRIWCGPLPTPCVAGRFLNSNNQCMDCPAGLYTTVVDQSSCESCDIGTFSTAGSTSCTQCPAGQYGMYPEQESCMHCAAGQSTAGEVGSTDCTICGVGKFAATGGVSTCTLCPLGHYGNETEQLSCIGCPEGRYQSVEGQTSCLDCGVGFELDATPSTSCLACPTSRYDPDLSSLTTCEICEPPKVVGAAGGHPGLSIDTGSWGMLDIVEDATDDPVIQARTTCYSCLPGEEPAIPGYDQCLGCPGGRFSPCGITCGSCRFPNVVNANKTSCGPLFAECPPGESCTASNVMLDVSAVANALESGTNVLPEASLEVVADPAALVPGSPEQEALTAGLQSDLANSLGIDPSFIDVGGIAPGTGSETSGGADGRRRRMQAIELILFTVTISGENTSTAITDMVDQLQDPASELMNSPTTSNIDTDVLPTFIFVCPAGMYRPIDEENCLRCIGKSIPNIATNYQDCIECPLGQAPSQPKQDTCVCDNGYYNKTQGLIKCYRKGEDWDFLIADEDTSEVSEECHSCWGMEHCINCLLDEVTMRPDFTVSQTRGSQKDTDTDQILTFENILGQRGVFPCEIDNTCTGDPLAPCAAGYYGPLCSLCADDWSRPGFKGLCVPCGNDELGVAWIILAGIAAICLTVAVLYFIGHFSGKDSSMPIPGCGGKFTIPLLITYGKIVLTTTQMVTQLAFTFELTWPEPFQFCINALKVFSMDWLAFLDVGCVTDYTYYHKFTFAVLILPILQTAIAILYFMQSKNGVEGAVDRCIKMTLTSIFLTYPLISQTTFQAFSCFSLDDGERWLDIDSQISCDDSNFQWFQYTLAIFGVMLYPLATPVLTLVVLLKYRKEIKTGEGAMFTRFDFLVADYKPKFYYFDVIEMARKSFTTGLMIFFYKGSVFQLVIGMVTSLLYGFSIAWMEPYAIQSANMFKLGTEAAMTCTMMLAVMMKVDMDREHIDETTVGLLLVLANLALPGGVLFIGISVYGLVSRDTDEVSAFCGGNKQSKTWDFCQPRKTKSQDFDAPKDDNNGGGDISEEEEEEVEFGNPVHA